MSSYSLSKRADEDLQRIYLDSIRYFGVSQAAKYKLELDRCFEKLAELPRLGRRHPASGDRSAVMNMAATSSSLASATMAS